MDSRQPNSYAKRFGEMMVNSLNYSLTAVEQAAIPLPDAVRVQAWHTLSYALAWDAAWPLTRQLLLALSPQMEQIGLRNDWLPYVEQGIRTAQTLADQTTEATLQLQAGWLCFQLGRLDDATEYLEASVAGFRQTHRLAEVGKALNRLAFTARRRRDYTRVEELVDQSLAILAKDDPERGNCYVVRGEVALDRRDWPVMEKEARIALAIWRQAGDRRRTAWALRNLGPALGEQQRYTEAIAVLQEALAILIEVHDPPEAALTQMNLATLLHLAGRTDECLPLLAAAEQTFREIQDQTNLAMLYVNRGRLHRTLGAWPAAQEDLKISIELWRQLGNLRSQLNAWDELGLTYQDQGDSTAALAAFDTGLAQLPQLIGQPGYERLHTMLTRHRCEAASDYRSSS